MSNCHVDISSFGSGEKLSKLRNLLARGTTIVFWFNPSCPHCVAVKPRVMGQGWICSRGMKMVVISGETSPELFGEFGISGVPVLQRYRDGNLVDSLEGQPNDISDIDVWFRNG